MKLNFSLSVLLCCIMAAAYAQNNPPPLLNIGDPAPSLRVSTWIKGAPIPGFAKGSVYVLEFWATWCAPCKAAMPHLSALARKYKDRVTIIGIDVYENETISLAKIKTFVDSMGQRMDYHVATGDGNFTVADWSDASGERTSGIPRSFVVNGEGKLVWIGHPKDLDQILDKIVAGSWDVSEALARRNFNKYLEALDDSVRYALHKYLGDADKPADIGKADSALVKINEIVKREPGLKYAPLVAYHTFSALLKTNPRKAYEYGKMAIVTPTYEEPPYDLIIRAINLRSDKSDLPAEIYLLGAEAYQTEIDRIPYPEIIDMYKRYRKMAEWYWRAGNKPNAIEAGQKAIDALKGSKGFSAADLAAFETQLQKYRKM